MKLTKPERIEALQLIPGVGRTVPGRRTGYTKEATWRLERPFLLPSDGGRILVLVVSEVAGGGHGPQPTAREWLGIAL
jgi:hypothetical protein